MDKILAVILFDMLLLILLISLLVYNLRESRNEHKKTDQIHEDLEKEREKTNKFHVSVEEIRRLTKG